MNEEYYSYVLRHYDYYFYVIPAFFCCLLCICLWALIHIPLIVHEAYLLFSK